LAGHPIRWRLLVELARSDLNVDEVTRLVGQPQGLVSYHLGQLRAGGLVSARRSSRDGRAFYYRAELDRCGESLASTGTALHPGLGLSHRASPPALRQRRARVRVLFVCTGNSARSQIAEALLEKAAGDRVAVVSAGSDPKPVHPDAVKVLAASGIDISGWHSKPLTRFIGQRFDYVVTLCDKVRERCPEFPGDGQRIHWSIEDPTVGSGRSSYPRFQRLSAELESRIRFLISVIDTSHPARRTRHVR
jgi:protein-tyrosine-phosphatase/DNA-binding transcriptional ArsR family regulator